MLRPIGCDVSVSAFLANLWLTRVQYVVALYPSVNERRSKYIVKKNVVDTPKWEPCLSTCLHTTSDWYILGRRELLCPKRHNTNFCTHSLHHTAAELLRHQSGERAVACCDVNNGRSCGPGVYASYHVFQTYGRILRRSSQKNYFALKRN